MDFKDVIIMTDLDGTLLTDAKEILDSDMEAINRFRNGGGLFSVATGRGYKMAKSVIEKLELTMPAVIFNGAAVFDFQKEEYLWQSEITPDAAGYIKLLMDNIPDIGIEVLHEQQVFVPAMNQSVREHLLMENIEPVEVDLDEIPKSGWLKVLIAYPAEGMDEVVEFAEKYCSGKVNWVRSAPYYYEMLPEGISKESGFEKLLELKGADERLTVACGDFHNDYDMIKMADLGVAVENALPEVKSVANLIVCDNNSGAISQVVKYIENI